MERVGKVLWCCKSAKRSQLADDDETLPSRLREFAEFNGVSEDVIIKRAIGKYVGMFGLKERPADSKATNIQDVFIEMGLHKPT